MSLELNDYGVQEMNQQEMTEVEGGGFWGWLGAAAMIVAGFVIAPVAIPLAIGGFVAVTADGLING